MWQRLKFRLSRDRRAERQLIRSDELSHWVWRARRQAIRRRASAIWLSVRQGTREVGQETRLVSGLSIRVLIGAVIGISLLVLVEALAVWLDHYFHVGSLFTSVSESSYTTLVAAAVAALATFLALFFTTVGVIASTAYSRVPGEIRQLFVRERTSTIYVRAVVLALVFGIALLTLPIVSARQFHGLTIVVFAVLTIFAVLSLAILGRSLFNFFDPSTLSERLYPQFLRAVRSASASRRHLPDEVQQQAAHRRAASVLARYGQLATLVSTREIQDGRAPERLAYQLLSCWSASAGHKSSIPTNSEWFARTASHPNWLTMDHNQLSTALQTSTGVQPTLSPDPLWVERFLASHLSHLLPAVAADGEWSRVIGLLDAATPFISSLGNRMQFDEAFLYLNAIATYRTTASAFSSNWEPDDRHLFELALAEREVLAYTSLWLGLVRPFERFTPEYFARQLDAAVSNAAATYTGIAPRPLLTMLEYIAAGVDYERRTEGHRVTPAWWVNHVCSRVVSKTLTDQITQFVSVVEDKLVTPLVSKTPDDAELAAVRIFDLLELLHKIGFHMKTATAALTALRTLRHDPSDDELWIDFQLPTEPIARMEEKLLKFLGLVALQLDSTSHDSSRADLFGQAYRRLFDAAFHAILSGQDDLSRILVPVTIGLADRARARLFEDLSEQRIHQQVIFGTEPMVDMMELSGYALLMAKIDGSAIGDLVRDTWNKLLDSSPNPNFVSSLFAVLTAQGGNFAITSGGVSRTQRSMELTQLLRSRGIVRRTTPSWMDEDDEPTHTDPIVAVFAADDMMGVHYDLADLFVVDYLEHRPEAAGLTLPRGAEMLKESVEFERRRRDVTVNDDGSEGEDGDAQESAPNGGGSQQ